jgi:hypothetical protein
MKRVLAWINLHLLSIWVVVFTAAVVWALAAGYFQSQALHEANVREAKEAIFQDAQVCIRSWDTREDIRDAIEIGTRGGANVGARAGAEAIISVATDAEPEVIAQFREAIDQQIVAQLALTIEQARAEIPDPECNLARARQTVDHGLEAVRLP